MKTLFLLTVFAFTILACKKKKENSDGIETPVETANGWDLVAEMPEGDMEQNNLHFYTLEYAKMHGNVVDAVITKENPQFVDVQNAFRWQYDKSSMKTIRTKDVVWRTNVTDPANDNVYLDKPYSALSKGLGDNELIFFAASGIGNVTDGITDPNRYSYVGNYIVNLAGDHPFAFSQGVQNYKIDSYARIFNFDGYDVFYGSKYINVGGGLNSNNRLITVALTSGPQLEDEITFSILEASHLLGNYPIISGGDIVHPAVVKKSYKISDLGQSFQTGFYGNKAIQERYGNIVTFIVGYDSNNEAYMFDLDIENQTLSFVKTVPMFGSSTYLLKNKKHYFVELQTNGAKIWNGNAFSDVTFPTLKTGSFPCNTFYNEGYIWYLVKYTVDGKRKLFLYRKKID